MPTQEPWSQGHRLEVFGLVMYTLKGTHKDTEYCKGKIGSYNIQEDASKNEPWGFQLVVHRLPPTYSMNVNRKNNFIFTSF